MASNQVARSDTTYYSGSPALDADFAYSGTMSGPWVAPIPVTFTLQRRGRCTKLIVPANQTAIVTVPGVPSITFSPAIPPLFRPVADSASAMFIRTPNGFFPIPYFSALLFVPTSGVITIYNFAGNFGLGDDVGVASNCTGDWPAAP